MKVEDVRKVLAVQAIEQSDVDGVILTGEDLREVNAVSGVPLPKDIGRKGEDAFLAERADLLLVRVASRFQDVSDWIRISPKRHRFGLLALALCLSAAIIGFLTNELGPDKRINILSFPLLGILAWSLFVYLRNIVVFSRKQQRLFRDSWLDSLIRFLQPSPPLPSDTEGKDSAEAVLSSSLRLLEARWRRLTSPVFGARIKSLLHFVALLLALSAILGMYFQGLANEYRAVWESTFFTESSTLRPFLQLVLGPAAALTGSSLPTAAELDLIHWSASEGEVAGENAARWIHWYAITIGLFVVLPRGLLSLLWKWRALHLAGALPFRDVSSSYFDHLLATSSGRAMKVLVVPYAVEGSDALRRGVLNCLESLYERPVEISWTPMIAFGAEEEISLPADAPDSILPLFSFASTPEKETHLTLLQTLSDAGANPVESLLLDTTSFDRKSDSFPDGEKRRGDRENAWHYLLSGTNIEPIFFHCGRPVPAENPPPETAR